MTPHVIASRGRSVYMVQVDTDHVRVLDTQHRAYHPPMPLQSVLARGYWEDAEMSAEDLRAAIRDVETDLSDELTVISLMKETKSGEPWSEVAKRAWDTRGRKQFEQLLDFVRQPDGGFTYSPVTGESPTTGYALSVHKGHEKVLNADDLTLDDLADYVTEKADLLMQQGNFLGAWHNPDDHKIYLDISTVVQDEQEAVRLAREHAQLAYFNLGEGKSIPTPQEQRHRARYEQAKLAPDWFGHWLTDGRPVDRALHEADRQGAHRRRDRGAQSQDELTSLRDEAEAHRKAWDTRGRKRDEVDIVADIERASYRTSVVSTLTKRLASHADAEAKVGQRVRLWGETSGASPDAARMQHAVAEEFGLTDAATDHLQKPSQASDEEQAFDRAFVRAEYDATQAWLKERGVTHLTVYRGMMRGVPKGTVDATITMQPASSWSLVESEAHKFTSTWLNKDSGVVTARIPVDRILSIGGVTGRGSSGEGEVIVLGGKQQVKLR